MPKENKKRGRRAENKRKLEEAEEDENSKRQKNEQEPEQGDYNGQWDNNADYVPFDDGSGYQPEFEFVGLLDEEEQEYFRKAGEMLEMNQFESPEDRNAFVSSVYEQADNKELKLANSQSCSRVLERLIRLSSPSQLKTLFQRFTGSFVSLFQHRFASHCCETLFLQAVPTVTEEMKTRKNELMSDGPLMADLFVSVINEIEEHLGFLMANVFGSHPLRVLLLVLAGEPIQPKHQKNVLHSRRKEYINVVGNNESQDALLAEQREVPSSFLRALETVIYKSVAGLDTEQLRSLTTHRVGNPILQLLLRLELTKFGKQQAKQENSILHTLLPDDNLEGATEAYIQGMMYDAIGSRLLEVIIEYSPGNKVFKPFYKNFIKDKLFQLCRADTASFVVCKAFARIGADDLQDAIKALGPQFPTLVDLNRLHVIRTLIDRAVFREISLKPLNQYIISAFADKKNYFDIMNLLQFKPDTENQPQSKDSRALHASLLAQALIISPQPLSTPILNSLTSLDPQTLLALALSPTHAPIITTALTPPCASTIPMRRKLVAAFYDHYGDLAVDPAGSRVVDAVWIGTKGLAFMRERVASELASREADLRSSGCGKKVWKGWEMELWKRRRGEWIRRSKEGEGERSERIEQTAVPVTQDGKKERKMTALEKARERHSKRKEEEREQSQKVEA